MSRFPRFTTLARAVALSTAVLTAGAFGAAAGPASTTTAKDSGYFSSAGASLVPPTLYDTGDANATLQRQRASGYFPTAGSPLVAPSKISTGDATATLHRQGASGYFAAAGAPLYSLTSNVR
jgi:hypothetical protein